MDAEVIDINRDETPVEKMQRQIDEMHAAITQLKNELVPALEAIQKGGIMSLLGMGKR